jgi:hypothetical protein
MTGHKNQKVIEKIEDSLMGHNGPLKNSLNNTDVLVVQILK